MTHELILREWSHAMADLATFGALFALGVGASIVGVFFLESVELENGSPRWVASEGRALGVSDPRRVGAEREDSAPPFETLCTAKVAETANLNAPPKCLGWLLFWRRQ